MTTSLDSYLSVDQDLPVAEEGTLSEITAAVRERDSKNASDDENREENDIDNNPAQPITSEEAVCDTQLERKNNNQLWTHLLKIKKKKKKKFDNDRKRGKGIRIRDR